MDPSLTFPFCFVWKVMVVVLVVVTSILGEGMSSTGLSRRDEKKIRSDPTESTLGTYLYSRPAENTIVKYNPLYRFVSNRGL